jgi:hypothetical protein
MPRAVEREPDRHPRSICGVAVPEQKCRTRPGEGTARDDQRMVLGLQRLAGNSAVAKALAMRRADGPS